MQATLKKYLAVARIGFEDGLEYRTEFFISLLGWSIRLMISLFIFAAMFKGRATIQSMQFSDIVLYFLVIQVVTTFTFTRVSFMICADIQNGNFSNYLVKPVSYLWYCIVSELAKNFVRSWLGIALFGIILFFYNPSFIISFPYSHLPIIAASILCAFFVNTFLMTIIALLSFWIVNANRLLYMFFAILSIFSGMQIPLQLFPEKFQHILNMTPFPYIFYYPTRMITQPGSAIDAIRIIGIQIGIIIIEALIVKTLMHMGIKKYEAVGK